MTNPNSNLPTSPALTSGVPAQPGVPGQSNQPTLPPYTIDISPGAPPDQKTLVYSPDVQILIARNNTQYDVSADLVSCSVARNENAVSTLVFKLANKDKRYNQKFERMDRVVCMMKRVTWIQVFSGYLDMVPHVQLYPGTVNFRASCTLKRVLHTWWDPGLPASIKIFDQAGLLQSIQESSAGESANVDAGIGSILRRFLVEVGGWSPQNIHVQSFPPSYYYFMQTQLQNSQQSIDSDVNKFKQLLLGDDISGATWGVAGTQVGVNQGSYAVPQGDRQMEVISAVDQMGMGPDTMAINASQGLQQSATASTDPRDKPAWQDVSTVTQNWQTQGKQSDAAIQCFMTIMVESKWIMYANNAVPDSLNYPHEALSTDGTLGRPVSDRGQRHRAREQPADERRRARPRCSCGGSAASTGCNMDRKLAVGRTGLGVRGLRPRPPAGGDPGGGRATRQSGPSVWRFADHQSGRNRHPRYRCQPAQRARCRAQHQQPHRTPQRSNPAGGRGGRHGPSPVRHPGRHPFRAGTNR